MKFSELLAYHRAVTEAGAFDDILGDAYLLRENPIYRRVRQRALALGAEFSPADAEYLLLPFNQLGRILATKVVPYVPHGRLMSEIERLHPNVFDAEGMPMPESYHLHEAAHVIADHCAAQFSEDSEARILRALLCESFANVTDALACTFAGTPVHRVLLKLNCYMSPSAAEVALMTRVRDELGEIALIRILLLSYLYANFLRAEVDDDLISATLHTFAAQTKASTKKAMRDCRALNKIAQRLDPLFRVTTTQNFLHLNGFAGDVHDLLAFDFRERLADPPVTAAIAAMVSALADDIGFSGSGYA